MKHKRFNVEQIVAVLKQSRGTQRYQPEHRTDEDALTRDIIALASEYGRYGYRRITALLQARGGWRILSKTSWVAYHSCRASFRNHVIVGHDEAVLAY